MAKKGALKSTLIVTSDELKVNGGRWLLQSGPAIRVRGFNSDSIGDRKIIGGDALPIYILAETDARVNGGQFLLKGGQPIQVTDVIGSARGVIQGKAIPVWPVDDDGNYDADFAAGITYLLLARFTAADQGYANGQVADTEAEGVEVGQLTIVEVDGTLAIVSNQCVFTAQGTPAWGDLGFYSQAIIKKLGLGLLFTINRNTANMDGMGGWWNSAALPIANGVYGINMNNAQNSLPWILGANGPVLFVHTGATDYTFAFILGGYDVNGIPWRSGETATDYLYGAAWYVKGGVFSTWSLLWRTDVDNTATLYAVVQSFSVAETVDDVLVPDVDLSAVLQPNNLSLFTAANGTSLDAITPEVGGIWNERNGNFDIQTNRANISVASGARDIATVPATVDDVVADVIIRKTNAVDAGEFGICLRYTDNDNLWMVHGDLGANQIEIVERNAAIETLRGSAAIALTFGTNYDVRAIAYGQTIDAFLNNGNKATYALAALNENVAVHGIVGNGTSETFDNFATYPRTSTVYDDELDAV